MTDTISSQQEPKYNNTTLYYGEYKKSIPTNSAISSNLEKKKPDPKYFDNTFGGKRRKKKF